MMTEDYITKEDRTMVRFNHITQTHYGFAICFSSDCGGVGCGCGADLALFPPGGETEGFWIAGRGMKALAETAQAGDTKGMMAILGPEGEDIISSGDAVADRNALERFVKVLSAESRFCKEKEDRYRSSSATITALPIPIVKRPRAGYLTPRREEEVLTGGSVETSSMPSRFVSLMLKHSGSMRVTDRERDGNHPVCQKFASDTYRRNGLYWR